MVLPNEYNGHALYLVVRLDTDEIHPTRQATSIEADFMGSSR